MRTTPALLIAVVALAGCGNEVAQEAAERSTDPLVAAAGRAAEDGSARVSVQIAAAGEAPATGEGVVDLIEGDEAQLTITVPDPAGPLTEEVLVVDGTTFSRGPQWGTDRWVRIDEGEVPPAAADDPAQALLTDPVAAVGLLEQAIEVTEAGPMTVRGQQAQRWTGTIDVAALAQQGDPAMAEDLAAMGLQRVPIEAAVDGDGRLVRVALTLDLSAAAASQGAPPPPTVTFAVELFDFGAPVEVQAPPPEQVVAASDLTASQPA